MDGISTPAELPQGIGARVVVIWLALLKVELPTETWVPRAVWKNAVRAVTGVGSRQGLQDYLLTAEDFGLIEVERGAGARQGRVKLRPVDAPGVFLPGFSRAEAQSIVTGPGPRLSEPATA